MRNNWPERTKEIVLNGWSAGKDIASVAGAAGVLDCQASNIIKAARVKNDPRAARRTIKGRKDGRSHDSRNIYRTPEEMASIREFVLERWAAGDTCRQIGRKLFLSADYAETIVTRARNAGDPRAVRRKVVTTAHSWERAVYGSMPERVWNLRQDGKTYDEIAAELGITPGTAASYVCRYKNKKATGIL